MIETKRYDVMVDLETLGKDDDAVVFQISAASFDISTGKIFDEFNQIADISKVKSGIHGDTLKWWLDTDATLLKDLLSKGEHPPDRILQCFHAWLNNQGNFMNRYLWGNGILFDNKIIQAQFNRSGYGYPIYYRNDRDVRTTLELASMKVGISQEDLRKATSRDGRIHDAMSDVRYQINLVSNCYNLIMGGKLNDNL